MCTPPPLVPPLRFSQVEEGVYRGAYPSLVNHRFLAHLRLRTVVSLLPEVPTPDLLWWCEQHGVASHAVVVLPFKKDEVTLSHEQAAELLQLLVTPERQPVYVHCLDGVTVTGTLIMCLRKLQRWAMPPIVSEYTRFDRRRGDQPSQPEPLILHFLNAFNPEMQVGPLLPGRLPAWLALSLQLVEVTSGGAAAVPRVDIQPLEDGVPSRSGASNVYTRASNVSENASSSAHSPSGPLVPSAPMSNSLHALAIEGLTMLPPERGALHGAPRPMELHDISWPSNDTSLEAE